MNQGTGLKTAARCASPETRWRQRIGVALAGIALALGGGVAAGCDDDDDQGPVEEAGQAVDEAGEEAGEAVEDADQEVGDDKD